MTLRFMNLKHFIKYPDHLGITYKQLYVLENSIKLIFQNVTTNMVLQKLN